MESPRTRHVDEAWRDRNDAMFRHLTEITERINDLPPGVNGRPNPMVHRLRRGLDEGTQRIVEANQGLVRSYVKRFTAGASIDDARDFHNAGTLGLMHAIATYQVGKAPFATWAYKRIQCEVLKAVRAADHPTISAGDFERRPAILRAVRQLAGTDESYIPSYAEIAAEADATVGQVRRVLEAPRLNSLGAPVGADSDGTTLGDTIADEKADVDDTVLAKIDIESLERYGLSWLDARELFVIVRRFGLGTEPPQHLLAIGEILGLSRETVRQIEVKALAKMRLVVPWCPAEGSRASDQGARYQRPRGSGPSPCGPAGCPEPHRQRQRANGDGVALDLAHGNPARGVGPQPAGLTPSTSRASDDRTSTCAEGANPSPGRVRNPAI